MKRTRCLPCALLLGWAFWWVSLLGWLGFDSSSIDPNGQPHATTPTWVTPADSAMIDPLGQPHSTPPGSADSDSSSSIDPDGHP
ncbi:MAG TPA: hypothetical protein VEW48_28680 [Thermoanaerobaculia bacterium]|nr:hypothetical protein [Thermoanaerobaculia bacterium]